MRNIFNKNKKAWIRIVEAFIAIIMIASVLTIIIVKKTTKTSRKEEMRNLLKRVLEEIANNASLREKVLGNEAQDIIDLNKFAKSRIPGYLNYIVKVCPIDDVCGISEYFGEGVEVYADKRVISSTLYEYDPKKVKLFIWEK